MKISGNYGTHLGPLIACMNKSTGDVLELGLGWFSTPYLHYQCLLSKRHLTSVDGEQGWIHRFADSDFAHHLYRGEYHDFLHAEDWDKLPIDKPWDVVLVDQTPDTERIKSIRRLADLAKYIVIHDSNPKYERVYGYSQIYSLFKYQRVWDKDDRHATVLSNLVTLDDLWE